MLLVATPLLEDTALDATPSARTSQAKAAGTKKKAGGGNRTRIISLEG